MVLQMCWAIFRCPPPEWTYVHSLNPRQNLSAFPFFNYWFSKGAVEIFRAVFFENKSEFDSSNFSFQKFLVCQTSFSPLHWCSSPDFCSFCLQRFSMLFGAETKNFENFFLYAPLQIPKMLQKTSSKNFGDTLRMRIFWKRQYQKSKTRISIMSTIPFCLLSKLSGDIHAKKIVLPFAKTKIQKGKHRFLNFLAF